MHQRLRTSTQMVQLLPYCYRFHYSKEHFFFYNSIVNYFSDITERRRLTLALGIISFVDALTFLFVSQSIKKEAHNFDVVIRMSLFTS